MGQAFEHLSKYWQGLGSVEFILSFRETSWFAVCLLENFWVSANFISNSGTVQKPQVYFRFTLVHFIRMATRSFKTNFIVQWLCLISLSVLHPKPVTLFQNSENITPNHMWIQPAWLLGVYLNYNLFAISFYLKCYGAYNSHLFFFKRKKENLWIQFFLKTIINYTLIFELSIPWDVSNRYF